MIKSFTSSKNVNQDFPCGFSMFLENAEIIHFLIMFQIIIYTEMRICQQNSALTFIYVANKTMSISVLQVKGIKQIAYILFSTIASIKIGIIKNEDTVFPY